MPDITATPALATPSQIIRRALPRVSFSVAALALFGAFGGAPPFNQTSALAQSPGGRIAFAARQGGNIDIYAMNADGSHVARLANDSAAEYHLSWSPDVGRVAFASTRDGGGIWVMNVDGKGLALLANNSIVPELGISSWSPDGRRIAFASGEIYTMNPDGSGVTRLTNNTANK